MRALAVFALSLLAFTATGARADDVAEAQLAIKDHAFVPHDLTIPAGQKVKITVTNQDSTPAEFESYELQREKVVAANSSITVFIGPLSPGTYPFFDDFHRDTTTGTVIAK